MNIWHLVGVMSICSRQAADCFRLDIHPHSPKYILLTYNGSIMALLPHVHFQSHGKNLLLRPLAEFAM